MPKLSLVIPAKNEEKRIARTLSNYGSFFDSRSRIISVEIIVVVSDSDDKTSKIVDQYSKEFTFIKKIETNYSSGKGGAVSLGFKNAVGEFVGFVDADGAVSGQEILKMFEFIDETPWLDGVIGVRNLKQANISLKRRILMKSFNLYARLFFNLPYKDTQCGAKIFRKKAADLVASKLSNTGWAFDVNILLVAKYLSLRIMEYPVTWIEKEGSKFSVFTGLIKIPLEFLKLKALEVNYSLETSLDKVFPSSIDDFSEHKRILIFAWRDIKNQQWGGSEVYVHEIAKRLSKKHTVTLFTSKPKGLSSKDVIDGVRVIRKGGIFSVYLWAMLYYLIYLRKRTDFIIDVQNGIPFFTPFYSNKPKIMVLHHVHKGQWFIQFNPIVAAVGYLIESTLMPLAYKNIPVITVSPSSMKDLKKLGFVDRDIFIAYNSIHNIIYGVNYEKSRLPMAAYVGRVKAYKRLEIALDVFKHILKKIPEAKFVIGGDGDNLNKLKLKAKKLGIDESVEFLGFVSDRKKWEIMQKAWVFLMPSVKEGWGITIIEAAMSGTPCVGFDVPGVRDSIVNGKTGYLAESPRDYYKKTLDLLEDKDLRNNLSRNCEKWASIFSWDKSTEAFDKVIDSYNNRYKLLENKLYPWDLDLRSEAEKLLK